LLPNRMRPRGRWPTGKSCKADENLRSWTCMNLTAGDDQATGGCFSLQGSNPGGSRHASYPGPIDHSAHQL
jgi:hypothetical protein